jgi:hypothetical protein
MKWRVKVTDSASRSQIKGIGAFRQIVDPDGPLPQAVMITETENEIHIRH